MTLDLAMPSPTRLGVSNDGGTEAPKGIEESEPRAKPGCERAAPSKQDPVSAKRRSSRVASALRHVGR